MTQTLFMLPNKESKPRGHGRKKLSRKTRKIQAEERSQTRNALIDAIKATELMLKQAYSCFNQSTDPDLVESYVYEINALQSRHNYLTRKLREGHYEELPNTRR